MKTNRLLTGRISKRIMLILIFAAVLFSAALWRAETASAATYKIKSAADWKNIGQKNGGTFKLTKNISLKTSQYLTINKNKKYTIDLNGYAIADDGSGSTNCPLLIKKGTVILTNSRPKKGGVLYSKEWMAVKVCGNAKLYMKGGAIVNDTVEFRTGLAGGIALVDKATCYIQGKSMVMSINNGVVMMGKAKLYVSGTPAILAGTLNTDISFTHYGSGINILESGCKVSLKGGRIGTMATPDVNFYGMSVAQSGSYPVFDRTGKVLKLPSGYVAADYGGNILSITGSNVDSIYQRITGSTGSSGLAGEKKLTTSVKDEGGYYSVFILKYK